MLPHTTKEIKLNFYCIMFLIYKIPRLSIYFSQKVLSDARETRNRNKLYKTKYYFLYGRKETGRNHI